MKRLLAIVTAILVGDANPGARFWGLPPVRADDSKRIRFTKGLVPTVLKRFPPGDKVRFIGSAPWCKVTG
ncbi:MAG: hypothetical protein ABSH53_07050 [Holophaga sp.]|jgi:hypothetical protein